METINIGQTVFLWNYSLDSIILLSTSLRSTCRLLFVRTQHGTAMKVPNDEKEISVYYEVLLLYYAYFKSRKRLERYM